MGQPGEGPRTEAAPRHEGGHGELDQVRDDRCPLATARAHDHRASKQHHRTGGAGCRRCSVRTAASRSHPATTRRLAGTWASPFRRRRSLRRSLTRRCWCGRTGRSPSVSVSEPSRKPPAPRQRRALQAPEPAPARAVIQPEPASSRAEDRRLERQHALVVLFPIAVPGRPAPPTLRPPRPGTCGFTVPFVLIWSGSAAT